MGSSFGTTQLKQSYGTVAAVTCASTNSHRVIIAVPLIDALRFATVRLSSAPTIINCFTVNMKDLESAAILAHVVQGTAARSWIRSVDARRRLRAF